MLPAFSAALAVLFWSCAISMQRHHVGVDHPERRLVAELTAQQADRFLIRVEVLVAAGHEAGDEDALERRHVQLRLDRRFDRDLERVGAAGDDRRGAASPPARRARAYWSFAEPARSLISLNSSKFCRIWALFGSSSMRLLVGLARLVELPLVLVGDGEVVERRGVGRIELDRFFPAVDRLAPESALGDADPERDLRLGVATRVGERRGRRQRSRNGNQDRKTSGSSWGPRPL